ncbi:hypothetical protein CBW65_10895 [Tumebacillus avium]|uniref:Endonuclease GajA/Old nuclease/RecF-like AAA domain-containing protein n=1 Tax=Tumebacillus avium TaxID=1903704 RepID=A0A1Y0INP9_9BACL|nr:AAA family ATPase [Tumebacillus avium]ARU61456.1 hypothetical protein CBW65_10895 [Tumebacillus avium]
MIAGLFIRHYKIYQGLYFIPVSSDYRNRYSVYVGNNGVGKSSIFEALNTFFNNAYWNKNKDGKNDETFIAPLFLIEKNHIKSEMKLNKETIDYLEFLSTYFWESSSDIHINLKTDEFKKFFTFRDELKDYYKPDDYYLF